MLKRKGYSYSPQTGAALPIAESFLRPDRLISLKNRRFQFNLIPHFNRCFWGYNWNAVMIWFAIVNLDLSRLLHRNLNSSFMKNSSFFSSTSNSQTYEINKDQLFNVNDHLKCDLINLIIFAYKIRDKKWLLNYVKLHHGNRRNIATLKAAS